MRFRFLVAAAGLLAAAFLGCSRREPPLVLVTTTSVGNSGLLDVLSPALRHDLSIDLRAHLVGSGRSLRMLEQQQADVAISHAPQLEADALGRHPGWSYRKLMFNDFVIVGPPADPARVQLAASAAEAMRRIAAAHATFASRGDSSGTHERERSLWRDAGASARPEGVITTGQGMAATLRAASAVKAYTLSDRATFAQLEPVLDLKVLHERDPALLNTYAVIVPDSHRRAATGRAARRFAEWLATGHGRELIAGFRVRGTPAFSAWPSERPGTRPEHQPR